MSLAFVFPGQGSQSVGMLAELAEAWPQVKACFTEASEALGYDLWQLTQEGPAEALNQTDRTQPAMLAAGIATWRVWQAAGGVTPQRLAGHSLGEYSALVAAGALDFAVALKLVEQRGQFMQAAVSSGQGAMAAILGLDDQQVITLCEQAAGATDAVVEAVNFNAPGQVVIAGSAQAVESAMAAAKEAGAKRVLLLPVSVPSHCALMRPAAERLTAVLQGVEISVPQIPVVNNVDVEAVSTPDGIRHALVRQLYSPVRWVETVRFLNQSGSVSLIECGPGKVLAGLNRRIERGMTAQPLFDAHSLNSALELIQ